MVVSMTQDEIIEMAKQSELGFLLGDSWLMHHEIEYFAKLVAQYEREACAKLLEDTADGAKNVDPNGFVWQAIKKSAELIRARGQA
jgi:predicted ATPase